MFFLKALSRLPLSVLYGISDFLFLLSYYVIRYRRALVSSNIENSFPEKSPAERKKIEREFYHNLCDYAVETLKLLTISREELARRHVFTNADELDRYKLQNPSAIGLASHQFNWEWLLAAGNFHFQLDFVYQPLRNKMMDGLLLECRTRFGGYAIKRNELGRELIKRKDRWRLVSIVADQYPGNKKNKRYITTFLNQETAFFQATDQIASLTQYPVVYTAIRKIKRGYYETTFRFLAEPPYEKENAGVIDAYIKAAEELIHENPSGWLWSHNRWKKKHLTQASAKYPPASTAS